MTDAPFESYCGSCSLKLSKEDYEELVWSGIVTPSCGHTSRLGELEPTDADDGIKRAYVPLGEAGRALKSNAETKKATWFVLTPDPDFASTFGEACEDPDGLLPMRSYAGAWDAYWSGTLVADESTELFLYELKVYRFMDFNPGIMQKPDGKFDTREFEGSRFMARDWDPTSLGVTVKKSYVRLVKLTEVTIADAPEGSAYGTRTREGALTGEGYRHDS